MVRNLNQIDEFIFENLQNLSFSLKLQKKSWNFSHCRYVIQLHEFFKKKLM